MRFFVSAENQEDEELWKPWFPADGGPPKFPTPSSECALPGTLGLIGGAERLELQGSAQSS